MADLFRALAYYYDHRTELEQRERDAASARRKGEERTRERLLGKHHHTPPMLFSRVPDNGGP